MLSIALQNSVFLFLVILITHFLVKSRAEEDSAQTRRQVVPDEGDERRESEDGAANMMRRGRCEKRDKREEDGGEPAEDLYSYVYGDITRIDGASLAGEMEADGAVHAVLAALAPPSDERTPMITSSAASSQEGGMYLPYEAPRETMWGRV